MARPKHRTQPGDTYFVTTGTWQRRALFHNPECASIVENALFRYRDEGKYLLHRYVIMPDHLHMLLTPGNKTSLEKALMLIKGGSSRSIGMRFGGKLPVWQPGFTEHQIRDTKDFESHVRYIDRNPVEALLAERPDDYHFGSLSHKSRLDSWGFASGAKALNHTTLAAGVNPRPSISVSK